MDGQDGAALETPGGGGGGMRSDRLEGPGWASNAISPAAPDGFRPMPPRQYRGLRINLVRRGSAGLIGV